MTATPGMMVAIRTASRMLCSCAVDSCSIVGRVCSIVGRVCSIVVAVIAATGSLVAQEPLYEPPLDGPAIALYGGIARGSLGASFAVDSRGLTRSGDCGSYESGTQSGVLAGVFGELPVTHVLGLFAGGELAMRDAEMSYPCVDPAGVRMPDGTIEPAETEFRATTSYTLATLQVGVTARAGSLPFVVAFTPSLSILTSADYSATEVIVSPRQASFLSGGQERAIGRGGFGSGDVSVALGASLWYEARIAERLWLVPRVSGTLALTDEISGGGIRSTDAQLTLGLMYRFAPPPHVSTPIEAGAAPATPR